MAIMTYWISTLLIGLVLSLSAASYLFHGPTIQGVRELGFPDFFRIELALLKIIAVIVLLLPSIPIPIKEWAYAGTALFFLTAIVAHIAHKDSIWIFSLNIIFVIALGVSRYSLLRNI